MEPPHAVGLSRQLRYAGFGGLRRRTWVAIAALWLGVVSLAAVLSMLAGGAQMPQVGADINDVFALPGQGIGAEQVWAVGNLGLILHSKDGGAHWIAQTLPEVDPALAEPPPKPVAQPPPPSTRGRPAEDPKRPRRDPSLPGNETAAPKLPNVLEQKNPNKSAPTYQQAPPNALPEAQPEGKSLPKANEAASKSSFGGLLPRAWAAGQTLPPPDAVTRGNYNIDVVYFRDAQTGWAVSERGLVFATLDGGDTWEPQAATSEQTARQSPYPLDGAAGIFEWATERGARWSAALLDPGLVYQPEVVDPDLAWKDYPKAEDQFADRANTKGFRRVHWTKGQAALGLDWSHQLGRPDLTRSSLSGGHWSAPLKSAESPQLQIFGLWAAGEPQPGFPEQAGVESVAIPPAQSEEAVSGWVTAFDGKTYFVGLVNSRTLIDSASQGEAWRPILSAWQAPEGTSSNRPVRQRTVWQVATQNQSATCTVEVLEIASFSAPLNGLCFLPGDQTGWLAAANGKIRRSDDGGRTWVDQTLSPGEFRLLQLPSWYPWWALGAILLILPAFVRERPIGDPDADVANFPVSDRPLEKGDPDPLQLNRVALGLSRFLRNENTQPPLTIAVTGEWGSGKSSLMNLVKADLAGRQFRPVWFNAWHHQKEQSLLASLLQNIRLQAVPRIWQPWSWVPFRSRLYWLRGLRAFLPVIVLAALAAFSAGYFYHIDELDRVLAVRSIVEGLFNIFDGKLTFGLLESTSLFGAFVWSIWAVYLGWNKLKAFGVNPAALMASASSKVTAKELEEQTGFRYRFSQEFCHVTKALGDFRLVIFIDDLDRCRPEVVVEVLEAVNFLVSSGRCFIVLALDRDYVETCVGLNFQQVADAMPQAAHQPDAGQPRRRLSFARQYLEKMINLEVPIPQPTLDQARNIMDQQAPDQEHLARAERSRLFGAVARVAISGLCCALFAAGLYTLFEAAQYLPKPHGPIAESSPPSAVTLSADPSASGAAGSGVDLAAVDITLPPPRDTSGQQPTIGEPGIARDWRQLRELTPFWLLLLGVAAPAFWIIRQRPEVLVKDSPRFTEAVNVWHEVVVARQNTPRAVKRFLNRVRYLAMRQRPPETVDPLEQRLWRWLRRHEPPEQVEQRPSIPEPVLVALAAIEHCDPAGMSGAAGGSSKVLPVISTALKRHAEEFPEADLAAYAEMYQNLGRGLDSV